MPAPDWVSYAALGVSGLAIVISGGMFATARSSLKTARAAHGTAEQALATSRESVAVARRAFEVGGHSVVLEAQVFTSVRARRAADQPGSVFEDHLVCDFTVTNTARGAVDIVMLACVFHDHEPKVGVTRYDILRQPPRWGPDLPHRLQGASQAVWSADLVAAFEDMQAFKVDGEPYLNGPFYFAVKLGDGSYAVDRREEHYIDRLLHGLEALKARSAEQPPVERSPPS